LEGRSLNWLSGNDRIIGQKDYSPLFGNNQEPTSGWLCQFLTHYGPYFPFFGLMLVHSLDENQTGNDKMTY
jgi:hypothetical protein